jgi:hypothetical protein
MFMGAGIIRRTRAKDEHDYFLTANDQFSILRTLEDLLPAGN